MARNRAAILSAARSLFEADGADVALEDVAAAAGLSRSSVGRHFPTRGELVAALWEADGARIEDVAASVAGDPAGIVVVFDHVLGQQVDRVALHPTPEQVAGPQLAPLVDRIRSALAVPLQRALAAGVVG